MNDLESMTADLSNLLFLSTPSRRNIQMLEARVATEHEGGAETRLNAARSQIREINQQMREVDQTICVSESELSSLRTRKTSQL